jgi:hypothetical protein
VTPDLEVSGLRSRSQVRGSRQNTVQVRSQVRGPEKTQVFQVYTKKSRFESLSYFFLQKITYFLFSAQQDAAKHGLVVRGWGVHECVEWR